LTLALNLTFSPGEKEQQSHVFGFADDLPANSVTQISKETANGFSFSVRRSAGEWFLAVFSGIRIGAGGVCPPPNRAW
jgi:hypothetical protein